MRSIIGAHPSDDETIIVTDMEAGIEHLSRTTVRHSDVILIVTEPYYRSLQTAVRIHEMAHDLGIPNVYVVANKVRTEMEAEAIGKFAEQRQLDIIATIPFDEEVAASSILPAAPLDYCAEAQGVRAVADLAMILEQRFLNGQSM